MKNKSAIYMIALLAAVVVAAILSLTVNLSRYRGSPEPSVNPSLTLRPPVTETVSIPTATIPAVTVPMTTPPIVTVTIPTATLTPTEAIETREPIATSPPTVAPTIAPTVAPTVAPTPAPTPEPTVAPTPEPEPPTQTVTTTGSGAFSSSTGTSLDMIVSWQTFTDEYGNHKLNVDLSTTSYSFNTGAIYEGLQLTVNGVTYTANSPAINYTGDTPASNVLGSFTVDVPEGNVNVSAVWHFRGSYGGTELAEISAGGNIYVS